ncbi:hypothetical protein ACIREO_05750 [Streptomyces sp. NPDC102441]|uniref:hypothetical protein n=1 Tax=Streptomyces sp. NPDC102441 TaxID=3366176 RepID=UPI00382062D2
MTALFVLDVPENEGVVRVARQDALLLVEEVGPYFRIAATEEAGPGAVGPAPGEDVGAGRTSADGQIIIDRRATGCRHAVWYSAIAGLQEARIVQHDKNALRAVRR